MSLFTLSYGEASATQPGILTGPGVAQVVGGGLRTWVTTHTDGAADQLAIFRLDEDTSSMFSFENGSSTNGILIPQLRLISSGANAGGSHIFQSTTDTGTNAVGLWIARIGTSTAVSTRPLYEWRNASTSVLQLLPLNSGADSALMFRANGTGAPSFTSRTNGLRLIIYPAISGALVDYGFGIESGYMWSAVAGAAQGYRWYGGTTVLATLGGGTIGQGTLSTTGGKIRATRIALTTPVTIAVTDDIVLVKLTTPGPVAVNWPASPETGREYCVVDVTGDANTNNITHTPAAGNFNGAATKVQNVAFSRLTAVYTGATWIGS